MHYQHIEKDENKSTDKELDEIHKMAQIALGSQVTKDCTKWAIKEGFFENLEALYKAGYRKESDTAKEILITTINLSDMCKDFYEFQNRLIDLIEVNYGVKIARVTIIPAKDVEVK